MKGSGVVLQPVHAGRIQGAVFHVERASSIPQPVQIANGSKTCVDFDQIPAKVAVRKVAERGIVEETVGAVKGLVDVANNVQEQPQHEGPAPIRVRVLECA